MLPPTDLKTLVGMRVVDRVTGRAGRIRSGRTFPQPDGPLIEVVIHFDGVPEPLGTIGDYYNLLDLDSEEENE